MRKKKPLFEEHAPPPPHCDECGQDAYVKVNTKAGWKKFCMTCYEAYYKRKDVREIAEIEF